ncbi:MAG: sugar nucleotide-binding protein [Candidatus Beckwithbacteria bacterium]
MNILIIGASSYVGARVYFDLNDNYEILGTYVSNKLSSDFVHLDITDQEEIDKVVGDFKPDVIVHVANNASSKWCDENPKKAILLNQTGTQYIVEASDKEGAKLIYISSLAAVNPSNLYGRTKLESEKIAKKTKKGWLILRPSLILGYSPNTTNDRPFNRILRNIDKGIPAVYEDAWNFQPTYLSHISEVISGCIKKDIWNETIPIVVPEVTTRFKIGKEILAPFGIKVEADKTAKKYFKDFEVKLDKLKKYKLPTYTYSEMVKKIIDEIKQRGKFRLT